MNFLYAAYGATWAIHIVYLLTIVRRYSPSQAGSRRTEEEVKALRAGGW